MGCDDYPHPAGRPPPHAPRVTRTFSPGMDAIARQLNELTCKMVVRISGLEDEIRRCRTQVTVLWCALGMLVVALLVAVVMVRVA